MEEVLGSFVKHGTERERIGIEADEVLEAILKGQDVDIEYTVIKGDLDIKKLAYQLGPGEAVKGFGAVSIQYSEILGATSFSSAIFNGNVNFTGTNFSRDAYFVSATFNNNVNFRDVTFGGDVYFVSAVFRMANFSATFNGDTSFNYATFSRNAVFISSIFNGDANFRGITFTGDAIFSSAIFAGTANFNSTFCGGTNFSYAAFRDYANFSYASFRKTIFFSGCRFNKNVDLEEATFTKEIPPECLISIGWAYRRSLQYGGGHFFQEAALAYLDQQDYSEASLAFKDARVEYEKLGKRDAEDQMYVQEKEATRLLLKSQSGNLIKQSWFWVWKTTSRYGESPLRFIGWLAVIVLFFGLVYMPIIPNLVSWWPSRLSITFREYPFHQWSEGIISGFLFNIVTAVYFSAVTFATLGFGDITPISIVGKLSAIAEVLLGYLMFGVLITLVARKMTRS